MRILITGHKGMLGSELLPFAKKQGHKVTGFDLPEHNITKRDETIAFIEKTQPDIIIHAAAFTAVDKCETEAETAYSVNADGTENVCLAAQELSIPIVYFSTDYIFDGEKIEPYDEDDAPNPQTVYGKSKYKGETFVRELCPKHYIVRIPWLCGHGGPNFVETILKLAKEKDEINVVNDQHGSPTFVSDLVPEVFRLIESESYGTYHITNQGYTTWYEFAKKIVELAGLKMRVVPCTTKDFPRPAPRPKNSRLSPRLYEETIGNHMPTWEEGLAAYLSKKP
ncbi:dTDP-4-dehydrorhamnose reductase [bacterium]|nr:dTDP-4-dehydrorhamnose reductase [bacterium]